MKKFYLVSILMVALMFPSLLANETMSSVECVVLNENIEKIVCKVHIEHDKNDRDVTFFWHSKQYPQDDREYSTILKANNKSVYDYRFLRGRAQGEWSVTAIIENTDSVKVDFILDGNTLK